MLSQIRAAIPIHPNLCADEPHQERTAFVARASRDQYSNTAVPFFYSERKQEKQEAIHSGLKLARDIIGKDSPALSALAQRIDAEEQRAEPLSVSACVYALDCAASGCTSWYALTGRGREDPGADRVGSWQTSRGRPVRILKDVDTVDKANRLCQKFRRTTRGVGRVTGRQNFNTAAAPAAAWRPVNSKAETQPGAGSVLSSSNSDARGGVIDRPRISRGQK